MPIDKARTLALIREAEEEFCRSIGEYIAEIARARAPVRRLERGRAGRVVYSKEYGGYVRIFRRNQQRRALQLGTISRYGFRSKKGVGAKSILITERNKKALKGYETNLTSLSARGRYEVRRGRALNEVSVFRTINNLQVQVGTRVQVGGRLKASIESSGPIETEHGYRVNISADPVDERGHHYAKYVEYPTRHTAAQPFLRPALKAGNRVALRILEGSLKEKGLK